MLEGIRVINSRVKMIDNTLSVESRILIVASGVMSVDSIRILQAINEPAIPPPRVQPRSASFQPITRSQKIAENQKVRARSSQPTSPRQ